MNQTLPGLCRFRLAAPALLAALAAAGCRPGSAETPASAEVPPSSAVAPSPRPSLSLLKPLPVAEPVSRAEEEFRRRIAEASLETLRKIAASEVVVRSVVGANAAARPTQAGILELDRRWRATSGADDPLLAPYLKNDCADLLRAARREQKRFLELFVADDLGCLVAASNRTSDYWQGDEEKWTQCFRDGDGRVFVDEINYDDSTQSYVVQISVPVHTGDGVTVGVLTASVQAHAGH